MTTDQRRTTVRTTVTAIAVLSLLLVAQMPALAQQSDPQPEFVVELRQNGAAELTIQMTYDLESDAERDAFRQLRDDEQAREQLRTRFSNRLQTVVWSAENATGREMSLAEPSADATVDGDVGVVRLSVTWRGLAAVDGDRLTVSEPFASGFDSDRQFRIVAPDGYRMTNVSPAPDESADGSTQWSSESNLDGFEATFAPAEGRTTSGDSASADVPGFGVGTAILGVLGAALLLARRS